MAKIALVSIREWKADDDGDTSLYEILRETCIDLKAYLQGEGLRVKSLRLRMATLARQLDLDVDSQDRTIRARLIVAWIKANGRQRRPDAEFSANAF